MAKKYLDLDGLSHFWQAIKNAFVADVTYNSSTKKIQKTKAGTASDVVTLSTVATSGSYSDLSNKPTIPNNFGIVKVGSTNVEADTTRDTLELAAGSNITLTADATNDKVTIAATDTTYSAGTSALIEAGTDTANRVWAANVLHDYIGTQIFIVEYGVTTYAQISAAFEAGKLCLLRYALGGEWVVLSSITSTVATFGNFYHTNNWNGRYFKCAASNSAWTTVSAQMAPLASPALTGTPTAPTAAVATDNTQIATTAFVHDVVDALDTGVSDVQIDGTSILSDSVADIPVAELWKYGVVKVGALNVESELRMDFHDIQGNNTFVTLPLLGATSGKIDSLLLQEATTTKKGAMSASDKTKLDGIATGAEVNQNAFSNVKVGSTTVAADAKTDTLELVAGSNITLTPDDTNDKVTIAFSGTIPTKTTTTPKMSGTAAIGSETKYAAGDHVHPSDTSRVPTSRTVNGKALSSNVTLTGDDIKATPPNSADNSTIYDWLISLYDNKAPLASPALTGTPTAPTAASGTNNTQIATTAFVNSAVSTAVTGATAYQGIAPTSFAPTNYKAGWYWIIGTAGTYVGQVCEAGDMIFCSTAASTYSASNFDVVQTNLDITSITNAEIDTIVAA